MSSFVYFDPDLSMIFLMSFGFWLGTVMVLNILLERDDRKRNKK